MKTARIILWCACIFLIPAPSAQESAPSQDPPQANATPQTEEEVQAWAQALWDSLDRQRGEIKLGDGVARLNVPDDFYYLNSADAEKVLVQVWGNPAGSGLSTLGMLFPDQMTPFDRGAWAVTIEYEEDGYVSDDDADELDYDGLLKQMQQDIKAASDERVAAGFESIELVGWASEPYYDSSTHKLHWAKEIRFGQQDVNTLNYNIRVLGRRGVLVMNFIAGMDQVDLIRSKADVVLAMAEFDEGSRYQDFNPDLDTVAAYGLGALVAGKVVAKTGLIAAAIIFLKKFGIIIFIAIGALLSRLFRSRKGQAKAE